MIGLSLINPFRYAYSSARVSALYSNLLSKHQFRKLLDASTLDEAMDFLKQTNYNQVISGFDFDDEFGANFDKALHFKLRNDIKHIVSISPKRIRPLLQVFIEHEEYKVLKSILKSIILGINPNYAISKIMPFGRFNPDLNLNLMKKSITEAINHIPDFNLKRKLSSVILNEEKNSLFEVDVLIDNYEIQKKISFLRILNGLDKMKMTKLMRYEVDMHNIVNTFRAARLGLNLEKTRKFWNFFSLHLDEANLTSFYKCEEDSISKLLIPSIYRELFIKITSSKDYLYELEINMLRFLSQKYYRTFIGNRLHFGIIWSYLKLIMYEIADIRTIILGKKFLFDRQNISKKLILLNGS
jgi:vacuolar-type H+-ATPase subunit C/Vma6